MKISKRSLYVLGIIGIVGISLSSAIAFRILAEPTPSIALSAATNSSTPVHLKITKASVDADIEQIGITPDGALDTPKDVMHAGWYYLGPPPGATGSAVIDGHFSWYNGVSAVFENLHLVQIGDKISTLDADGVTTTFVVTKTKVYDPNGDASDIFTSTDGKAHLNIITCEGVWNKVTKNYSGRLVVFSEKE